MKHEIYEPSFESNNEIFSSNFLNSLKQDMIGSNEIALFIERQLLYRKKMNAVISNNLLLVNFEDLVLKYDKTIVKIINFLELNNSKRSNKKLFFNPSLSIKNVMIGKKYANLPEVKLIEKKLAKYLYKETL